jgi:RNA polymerase sigma-70 factor (ECF subfamily)
MNRQADPNSSSFFTTQWSVVRGAVASSIETRQTALEQLCTRYWMPLYAFLRKNGYGEHDSQDLVQGFFEQLLSKEYLKTIACEKGRFRSFMLVAIKHYASNERDRANALKRGGGARTISIDFALGERWYQVEPADKLTAEMLFERRWALSLLDNVMVRLSDRFALQNRAELFDYLKPHLIRDSEKTPYAEIAENLHCSVESLKSTMHRIKGWYRELLRDEIAQTVSSEEVDDELNRLREIISGNT